MDYALRFNKRSVKLPGAASANVVAAHDSKVEGVLYALSREDDIFTMDPFEGYRCAMITIDADCLGGWYLFRVGVHRQ